MLMHFFNCFESTIKLKDLDGAKHGRLHGDDEDLQNKLYKAVYALLRSGRITEVNERFFAVLFCSPLILGYF